MFFILKIKTICNSYQQNIFLIFFFFFFFFWVTMVVRSPQYWHPWKPMSDIWPNLQLDICCREMLEEHVWKESALVLHFSLWDLTLNIQNVMYKLHTVHAHVLWPLGHCTCTRYIDSIQTMAIFKVVFHIDGKENQG